MSSSSDSDDLVDTAEPHSLLFWGKKKLQRVKRGSDSNSDNLHISADANQVV